MFNNELMADVHFVVGPPGAARRCLPTRLVEVRPCALPKATGRRRRMDGRLLGVAAAGGREGPGLRAALCLSRPQYVLAVGSSVFYAMFYGDLAEVKSEIHIPDVEPAAFLILLK